MPMPVGLPASLATTGSTGGSGSNRDGHCALTLGPNRSYCDVTTDGELLRASTAALQTGFAPECRVTVARLRNTGSMVVQF